MSIQAKVFVGSASEHIRILKRLNILNEHSKVRYVPWTNLGVFEYSEYTLDSLVHRFSEVNGAAFLFFGADKTWWRGHGVNAPRDNVVFEAGIAIATFGIKRTAIVTDATTKLPSDLAGLTTIRLNLTGDEDSDASDLHARLERFFEGLSATDQHVRQFWVSSDYAIYFHSFDNPEKGEFEEIVNVNAVRAVGCLTDYFGRAGIKYTLHSSRSQDLMLDGNLVLLGSSASNRITKSLAEELSINLPFSCDFEFTTMADRYVIDRRSGMKYASRFQDGTLVRDFGVLTKVANPYRSDSSVVIAAGNYGFGTLGAALLAIDAKTLMQLPFAPHKSCQLIAEIPVLGRFAFGQPRLIDYAEITET